MGVRLVKHGWIKFVFCIMSFMVSSILMFTSSNVFSWIYFYVLSVICVVATHGYAYLDGFETGYSEGREYRK